MACIFCTAASSREPLTPTIPGFSRALVFHFPCARYRQQAGLGLEALPRAVCGPAPLCNEIWTLWFSHRMNRQPNAHPRLPSFHTVLFAAHHISLSHCRTLAYFRADGLSA